MAGRPVTTLAKMLVALRPIEACDVATCNGALGGFDLASLAVHPPTENTNGCFCRLDYVAPDLEACAAASVLFVPQDFVAWIQGDVAARGVDGFF